MNAGWLVLSIVLLLVNASCMISTVLEVAMGKTGIASTAGAILSYATVDILGVWIFAITAS